MLTFWEEPEKITTKRIAYREYKNPPYGEGYRPIKDTYDNASKTIEVEESNTVKKWNVIFEDISYTLYAKSRYAEKIIYNGKYKNISSKWVTDLYIDSCSDDVMEVFKEAFCVKETFSKEYQKTLNESNKEFDIYINIEMTEEIPKENFSIQGKKILLTGIYWDEDRKYLYEF